MISFVKAENLSKPKPKTLIAKEKQEIKDNEMERSVDKFISELMNTLSGFSKCNDLNPNESTKLCKTFTSKIDNNESSIIPFEKLMTLKKMDMNKNMIPYFVANDSKSTDNKDTKLSDFKSAQDAFKEACLNFEKIKLSLNKKNKEKTLKGNKESKNSEDLFLTTIKTDYDKMNGGKANSYFEKFCLPIVTFIEYLNDMSNRPRSTNELIKIPSDLNSTQLIPAHEAESSGQ
jgi:hypothetical protein